MSEKHQLFPLRLRYKGIFDFDGLYKIVRNWFEEQDYEFYERQYKHKQKVEGAEIEVTFESKREINEYAMNRIKVFFHLWECNEVEVEKEGKKKMVFKGRMQIDITPTLDLDYKGQWEGSWATRKWRSFYNKFVIKHEIEDVWEDKLHYYAHKLHQDIKLFLDMESHSPAYDDMW